MIPHLKFSAGQIKFLRNGFSPGHRQNISLPLFMVADRSKFTIHDMEKLIIGATEDQVKEIVPAVPKTIHIIIGLKDDIRSDALDDLLHAKKNVQFTALDVDFHDMGRRHGAAPHQIVKGFYLAGNTPGV